MKTFGKLILISLLIAIPVSHFLAQNWLENFSYKIELNPWIYIMSGVMLTVLTLLTISYQSIKAAIANPVDSFRDE